MKPLCQLKSSLSGTRAEVEQVCGAVLRLLCPARPFSCSQYASHAPARLRSLALNHSCVPARRAVWLA